MFPSRASSCSRSAGLRGPRRQVVEQPAGQVAFERLPGRDRPAAAGGGHHQPGQGRDVGRADGPVHPGRPEPQAGGLEAGGRRGGLGLGPGVVAAGAGVADQVLVRPGRPRVGLAEGPPERVQGRPEVRVGGGEPPQVIEVDAQVVVGLGRRGVVLAQLGPEGGQHRPQLLLGVGVLALRAEAGGQVRARRDHQRVVGGQQVAVDRQGLLGRGPGVLVPVLPVEARGQVAVLRRRPAWSRPPSGRPGRSPGPCRGSPRPPRTGPGNRG